MSKKTATSTENNIPIIDLAPLFGNDPRREYIIAQNLEPAFLGKGFLILINHGISQD
jgi:isopenicillin N synthase-like dioxygenase